MIKLKEYDEEEFSRVNEQVAKTSPMSKHYNSNNAFEARLFNKKRSIIANLLQDSGAKSVVDVGCGDGGLAEILQFKKIKYFGIDVSKTQIGFAKNSIKNSSFTFIVGDAAKMKLKENSFDAAICTDVIEHVREPLAVFENLKRIVKSSGLIILSIPNEYLWCLARLALLRFPLHSPDHLNAMFPSDIKRHFKNVKKTIHLPFNTTFHTSLMSIFVICNDK